MGPEASGNEDEDDDDDEDEDDKLPSAEESGDSSEDSGDSGEDSDDDEVDLELRNKIEEALRVNGIEPATGDTDSEEEELMDDDQMMVIDEQLAQVFRSRATERKSGKSELGIQLFSKLYLMCHFQMLMPNEKPPISRTVSSTLLTRI